MFFGHSDILVTSGSEACWGKCGENVDKLDPNEEEGLIRKLINHGVCANSGAWISNTSKHLIYFKWNNTFTTWSIKQSLF